MLRQRQFIISNQGGKALHSRVLFVWLIAAVLLCNPMQYYAQAAEAGETTYTVQFISGEHGSIIGESSEQVVRGRHPTFVPQIQVDAGYIFLGWSLVESGGSIIYDITSMEIRSDTNFYAQYEKETIKLSYNAGANGTILGATSEMVPFGEYPASVPSVVPEHGYTFIGWSSDGGQTVLSADQVKQLAVTAPITYTAYYNQNTYIVTYLEGDYGTIEGSSAETLKFGEYPQHVPEPVTNIGYSFIGWSRDGGETLLSYYDVRRTPVTEDVYYTAFYRTSEYIVTYAAGANGAVIGAASEVVPHGAYPLHVPEVEADDGYSFAGWSSDGGLTKLSSEELRATGIMEHTAFLAFFTTKAGGLNVIAAPAAEPGTESVTVISVKPAAIGGNRLQYKNFGQESVVTPNAGDLLEQYADLPQNGVISAAQGDAIAVAEVDAWNRVVRFGQATAEALPAAPVLTGHVEDVRLDLRWELVPGSQGYNIYEKTEDEPYSLLATVQEAVYEYRIENLVYGQAYYYKVSAVNSSGESLMSNEIKAVAKTAPQPPINIVAKSGHLEAVVSFTPPANDGGDAIQRYEVLASPGGIAASGTSSPVTVTGLTNGVSYTFTVSAINSAGSSAPSAASNAIVPAPLKSQDYVTIGGGGVISDEEPVQAKYTRSGQDVILQVEEYAETVTSRREDGMSETIYRFHSEELLLAWSEAELPEEGRLVVPIEIEEASDRIIAELDGPVVAYLEEKEAYLQIHTAKADYSLAMREIDIHSLAAQLGATLEKVKLRVDVADASADVIRDMQQSSMQQGFALDVLPIQFSVKGIYDDRAVEVNGYGAYAELRIPLPEWAVEEGVATAVAVETEGKSMRHVPTRIEKADGQNTAIISSMSNGIYAIIRSYGWFWDMEQHWARDSVFELAARKVVNGKDEYYFSPDQFVTRGEFAAILTRGLGLEDVPGESPFRDVQAGDWFSGAVNAAHAYGLIDGFEDGAFQPDKEISREEAMQLLARAMTLTKLDAQVKASAGFDSALDKYMDQHAISGWARDAVTLCLEAGIVSGRGERELAPKLAVSRAEVAVMVQRLLRSSGLIDAD